MRAIDTHVLVRLIVRDDSKQVLKAEAFIAKGAWVSTLVLTECIWVLESVYELTKEQVCLVVKMLLNHAELSLQNADVVTTALRAFKVNTKIDFSDCLILALAKKAGHAPLGTFDKAFSKLEGCEGL